MISSSGIDSFRLKLWKRTEPSLFLSSAVSNAGRYSQWCFTNQKTGNIPETFLKQCFCLMLCNAGHVFSLSLRHMCGHWSHNLPDSVLEKRAALMSLSRASQALLCACSGNFPLKSSRHSRASATYLSSNRHRAKRKWAFRCPGFSVRAFRQSRRAS